ncbi:alpha-2-macroglobulin-like [Elgaria multicarinata webbii]|uniref:alpha-2-macroglobulin-like n=1 Tax=Elgaria multicarinata webbii TaxID=159646 RepID=UPI002FCD5554
MGTGRRLGGFTSFLLLLFLLPWDTAASAPEPQYLVLVPVLIHTETSEKICVQLSHLNESVTLSVTLEHGAENRSLREVTTEKDVFECVPFKIPKWTSPGATKVFLTVLVEGATLHFWSRKTVLVKNVEGLVFVQTDKPIYKPGQEVQFRIVCLDEDFHPINEKIPLVYIEDPKKNRLAQWRDIQLNVGLIQLSFPLASEPAQGNYKVVVQKDSSGLSIERRFEVKEYVPPSFEVMVKAPKRLTIMDDELEVSCCGLYTYGKPVPGLVNISVCRPYNYIYGARCFGKKAGAVCEEFSGTADAHGCFSRLVKTKVFPLQRSEYQMNLNVECKITEEGTGFVLKDIASTDVTSTLSIITFQRMQRYYRRGLPITGQLTLKDGVNKPITNARVEVRAGSLSKYVAITDDHGQAQFSINTDKFKDDAVNIQAFYKSEQWCDNSWITPQHSMANHTVYHFYSPSGSYLQIESVPGTLSCDQTQPVRVHYALNQNAVRGEEVIFHYVLMGKGTPVHAGTHTEPLEHAEVLQSQQQEAADTPEHENTKGSEHHTSSRIKGVFLLNLPLDVHSAPLARLLVYTVLPNGELAANSADFTVENCFANKVKLEFEEPASLPASNTHLHLSVSKPSLCAVHAVDKIVSLLKPEAELSPKTVYNLLPVKVLRGYDHEGHSLIETKIKPCVHRKEFIKNGTRFVPEPNEGDSYQVLQDFGLKVFTSTKIHKPNICQEHEPSGGVYYGDRNAKVGSQMTSGITEQRQHAPPVAEALSQSSDGHPDVAVVAEKPIRTLFPETWLWLLHEVKASEQKGGEFQAQTDIPVTVPDTITEWKAGAFCLSEEAGFGLAPSTSLNVFQPFFIEVTLPYSVVRGEVAVMKATTFNYLNTCLRVHVTLAPSDEFDASPVTPVEESYCLCENERKSLSWNVTPKILGEMNITVSAEAVESDQPCGNEVVVVPSKGAKDTVIKTLLVEPEGIEKGVAINSMLCADETSRSTDISLKLPENVVEGSARATHCVLGDMLGGAIQNLQNFNKIPFGCWENMALFAPNIYIMDYLNKTGQLTERIQSTITRHLLAGYQRQLNCKHSDGSYSTFGPHHLEPAGNTRLTAFVLKSFTQAKRLIFIEERHITEALAALAKQQKGNGCFQSTGFLWQVSLKGGDYDDVQLSAYITIALLEMGLPLTHSVVRNAMLCLETASQAKDADTYTWALMAYAFTLAGKEDKRQEALRVLDERAVREDDGGSLHWKQPEDLVEHGRTPHFPTAALSLCVLHCTPSVEVEMTAYVLLAYVARKPEPTQEELTKAMEIVSWLSKQQNPNGGFSSTQDTVMALQAFSKYAALIHSKGWLGADVTLSSGDQILQQFHLDSTNRLLLQCQAMPNVPGDYTAAVAKGGCAFLRTTLKYNVQLHHKVAPFKLDVHTVPETCTGAKAERMFQIAINVSYTGKRHVSNMAIVDVKMLSGHFPVKSSVKKLEHQTNNEFTQETPGQFVGHFDLQDHHIKRTEVTPGHVLLYLDQVTNKTQSFSFTVERDVAVQGLKAAVVKIYDYYETDEYAIDTYSAPCSTGATKHVKA